MPKTDRKTPRAPRRKAQQKEHVAPPERIEHVDLTLVDFNPWQPRASLDEDVIAERAESIKANGMIQLPTGRAVDGRVQIAEGAYRFAAYSLLAKGDAEYRYIPIRLLEYSDVDMAMTGLEANRQRKDLSTLEEARAFKRILDEFEEIRPVDLAKRVGLSRSALSHYVNTLDLPAPVLEMAEEMGLTLTAMRDLRRLMGKEHVHEQNMIWVLKRLQSSGAVTVEALGAVWKTVFHYGYIADTFPGKWKSLNEEAYPAPRFDVEVFTKAHGEFVHVIPGVGAFTCQASVWESWQKEALQEEEKQRQEVAPAVSILEVATEGLPELAQPVPDEDAGVEEPEKPKGGRVVAAGPDVSIEAEIVPIEGPPGREEGVLRIPLQQLIPELTSGPDAGSKILPDGFAFEEQQKYLEELLELVAEGRDLADILAKEPDLVERALGTRAKVYPLGGLPHNAYEALESYNLERIQRPRECLTQCTWGFALGGQYGPPKDGVAPTRRLCLNKACFKSKAGLLTASRNKRGKTGLEKEREVVEQAARGMVENGTVNLGKGQCLLILHTLTEGSTYQGSKQIYWWEPLLPHLGIQGKGVSTDVREEAWTALQERDVDELRYFVGLMMLERVRSHAKPTEWKPSLNPWLKLLDTPHLEGGSEVEMAEPAKR